MTKHNSASASPAPAIKPSSWSDFAIQDAVAKLPHNSGATAITEMMTKLAVNALSNPRLREVGSADHGVYCAEEWLSGGGDACAQKPRPVPPRLSPMGESCLVATTIRYASGAKLPTVIGVVKCSKGTRVGSNCLQVLPDGRIVSGDEDATFRIWSTEPNGTWTSEVLKGRTDSVRCFQALPDGRIVSGSSDNTIRIWSKQLNDTCLE